MNQRLGVIALSIAGLVATAPTLHAQQHSEIPPAPAELAHRRINIVVRLTATGLPTINDQPIPWARLGAELDAIFETRPERILFIEVARSNRVVDVSRVAALAKQHGVKLYALAPVGAPKP